MNIYQKLLEVRKAVPFLQKDASGQQYKYNSSSQVITAVRAKLDEMNILLISEVTSHNLIAETVEYIDKDKPKKTTTYFTEVDLMMTWVNADNPEEKIKIPWYAQGVDIAGEKGVGKALTYGEKTFMLKQFNIPTDQMDVDAFQERMQRTTAVLNNLASNLIAQIKSEWLGAGFKANDLNAQVTKLYGCKLAELSEEQGNDFIDKIRAKKGGKAS